MFWERYCALCISARKAPNVVASEIGVKSSGTVTGWKNGAVPRIGALRKIADYFGVSVEYLTGEPEQKEKPPTEVGGKNEEPFGYSELNAENREFINQMIAKLLASQSQQ